MSPISSKAVPLQFDNKAHRQAAPQGTFVTHAPRPKRDSRVESKPLIWPTNSAQVDEEVTQNEERPATPKGSGPSRQPRAFAGGIPECTLP